MNPPPPEFSIVAPVYNEAATLDELVRRLMAVCRDTGRTFEIVLVDDGSEDDSPSRIHHACDRYPEVVGVFLNRNYGQHAAVFAGMAESRGHVAVITLDADLQNPPEEVPRLLAEIDRGADVVGTVRQNRQDTLFRRLASLLVNRMVQRATGVAMHDYGCMLRAYRRPIVDAMLQCRERSTFIPVLANAFARTTAEIPVAHAPRRAGRSKYSLTGLLSLQFDLLTSISTFPLRLLSLAGLAIAAGGMGFATLLVILRLVYGASWAAEGVFTLFAVLFVFVGAQFIGLGLLGEYIGRIYQEARGRPRYLVHHIRRRNKKRAGAPAATIKEF